MMAMSGPAVQLPNPPPDEWLADYTQMMQSAQWYGYKHFGPTYGNFWSPRPCRRRPHRWRDLGIPRPTEPRPRHVYRCQRCGSQIFILEVRPPARGIW